MLLVIPLATAATIQGTAYDYTLEPLENVVIIIDTTPVQQFLSRDGSFEIVVPPGEYTLQAQKGELATTETFTVQDEGVFLYDLFLFSSFAEEDELLGDIEETVTIEQVDTPQALFTRLLSVLVVLAAALGIGWYILRKKEYEQQVPEKEVSVQETKTAKIPLDLPTDGEPLYLKRVLDILKKHDGRITQKQLRKEMMDLSESKVSLIITELEHKGKVEKVKRGRGNVILLKR